MGLRAISLASFENIIAPSVKTIHTKIVLAIENKAVV
jgi:hypothetical protein